MAALPSQCTAECSGNRCEFPAGHDHPHGLLDRSLTWQPRYAGALQDLVKDIHDCLSYIDAMEDSRGTIESDIAALRIKAASGLLLGAMPNAKTEKDGES